MDESVPWLCATGNYEKAERILSKAGKMNGIKGVSWRLRRDVTKRDVLIQDDAIRMTSQNSKIGSSSTGNDAGLFSSIKITPPKKEDNVLDVFRHSKLRLYVIILSLLW